MGFLTSISFFIFLLVACSPTDADAARFDIRNNCSFTVWAAAVPVGGHKLEPGQSWPIDVGVGPVSGRIWGRTGCSFDRTGRGSCQTGDCGGLLHCQGYGTPPNTLAEYSLNESDDLDHFNISLVDGFNVPMEFIPDSGDCTQGVRCAADIKGQCPNELRAPEGCNNPCTVFKTDQYCCNSGNCGPTNFSMFFKDSCPDAYSYPMDDATSTFTCPGGRTNYRVVFCPSTYDNGPSTNADAAKLVTIRNDCPYTVWAAAVPGGGRRLDRGQNWTINVVAKAGARIWARTGCNFDRAGRGKCQTGDCNGQLQCQTYGTPPNTLIEYAFNQFNNMDFFDISLVDGFNVPVKLNLDSGGCVEGIRCAANINEDCPSQLRVPGGCNGPCTVFKTSEYCCNSVNNCGPTNFSSFFKEKCPVAYSYPFDDNTSAFSCREGTNYRVVFCP